MRQQESKNEETKSAVHLNEGLLPENTQFHQDHQIKWVDLDFKKFFVLNLALNFAMDAITYPIELVRTRLQVQGSSMIQTSYPTYKNSLDGLFKVAREEGASGLFKGFNISQVGYVSSHIIYYSVYEVAKQRFQEAFPPSASTDPNANVFISTGVAGAIAEIACCVISVPTEVATTRLQIQGSLSQAKYTSGIDVLSQVYRCEGVQGWYRGLGGTILRGIPSSAIWWGAYEVSKNKLHAINFRDKVPFVTGRNDRKLLADGTAVRTVEDEDPLLQVTAGAIASVVSTVLINPIDVAKTRLQSVDTLTEIANTPPFFRQPVAFLKSVLLRPTTLSILKRMVREEGFRSLGKGLTVALFLSVPHSTAHILGYEWVKKLSVATDS